MLSSPDALLDQLIFFMLLSGLLALLSLALIRLLPSLRNWSLYWLFLLIAVLVSLVPISFEYDHMLIADAVLNVPEPHGVVEGFARPLDQDSAALVSYFVWFVLFILMLGSVIALIRFIVSNRQVYRLIASAHAQDSLAMFSEPQAQFIQQRSIRVFVTPQSVSPFVWGVFRTYLVIPVSVLNLPLSQFQLLVDHELTHIRRGDQRSIVFFRVCSALLWFNPLIRFIEKQFNRAMELNCDAEVVSRNPCLKHDYARALVASLRLSKPSLEGNTVVHFSDKKSTKKEMEERIRQTMRSKEVVQYGLFYKVILSISFALLISFSAFARANTGWFQPSIDLYNGIMPVASARMSSGFGVVNKIRNNKPHRGIDLAAPIGTDVIASFAGEVMLADSSSLHKNFGLTVLISHGNVQTLYAHLDSVLVSPGDRVSAGQPIGTVGETGRATGPHLHFELIKDGEHIDPALYLK